MEHIKDMLVAVMKSKGFKSDVTFKELHEKTKKKLSLYSLNFNKFEIECFNYINTPDLEVLRAIYMSATFPFLFSPYYYNGSYYLDGGCRLQTALSYCLKDGNKKDEIICIRKEMHEGREIEIELPDNSNMFSLLHLMIVKLVDYSRIQDDYDDLKHSLVCYGKGFSLGHLHSILDDENVRRDMINEGREFADTFLIDKLKHGVNKLS